MTISRFMHRRRKDQDLAEEIESHLAHEQDRNAARGLPPQEARRQARLRFGNPRATRERVWRYRSFPWLEDLWRDLQFALRGLGKTPGFTIIAILVIAVGDRREYCRLFRHQYCAAQTADLSRSAVTVRDEEYQPTGIVSGGEHPEVQYLASANWNFSAGRGLRLRRRRAEYHGWRPS